MRVYPQLNVQANTKTGGVLVFRKVQQFNIQKGSLSNTARVSVEVRWLQRPAGIQHLASFSSELSLFVLYWSHCQGCRLLNATAPLKKTGQVFLNSLL